MIGVLEFAVVTSAYEIHLVSGDDKNYHIFEKEVL